MKKAPFLEEGVIVENKRVEITPLRQDIITIEAASSIENLNMIQSLPHKYAGSERLELSNQLVKSLQGFQI